MHVSAQKLDQHGVNVAASRIHVVVGFFRLWNHVASVVKQVFESRQNAVCIFELQMRSLKLLHVVYVLHSQWHLWAHGSHWVTSGLSDLQLHMYLRMRHNLAHQYTALSGIYIICPKGEESCIARLRCPLVHPVHATHTQG